MTFLTIAIPVYNKAQHIEMCVESIIDQKKNNYEILLVDDGSTDNSLEICNKYAKNFKDRIRVISCPNQGSIIARRICIENAKGEYIWFVDADDYLIDNRVTQRVESIIKKERCDLLIFNYVNKSDIHSKVLDDFKVKNLVNRGKEELYLIAAGGPSFLNPLFNKVFHRSLIDLDSYDNFKTVKNGTDYFQMLPILTNAKSIFYFETPMYVYNNSGISISRSFNKNIYSSLKQGYYRMVALSKKWGKITDEDKFNKACGKHRLMIVSTAAFKTRLCGYDEAKSFLNDIVEDSFFRESFKKEYFTQLFWGRRFILWLLYKKQVSILYTLIQVFDKIIMFINKK